MSQNRQMQYAYFMWIKMYKGELQVRDDVTYTGKVRDGGLEGSLRPSWATRGLFSQKNKTK